MVSFGLGDWLLLLLEARLQIINNHVVAMKRSRVQRNRSPDGFATPTYRPSNWLMGRCTINTAGKLMLGSMAEQAEMRDFPPARGADREDKAAA
jgi:hypothetical protein